jgi:hypothetical protein
MEDTKEDKSSKDITVSGCISNRDIIKYFVQVSFSFILVIFSIFMIAYSKNPSDETLWITLLTSTATLYINAPKIESKSLI